MAEVVSPDPFFQVRFSLDFFPKQFTVGVLNATLDLAALVLVGVVGFLGSEVVLSPVVSRCLPLSGCLPSCGGWVLVGVAASRTKIFRNQNHRFQSRFAYCKLFGVYAGVIVIFLKVGPIPSSNCNCDFFHTNFSSWSFVHNLIGFHPPLLLINMAPRLIRVCFSGHSNSTTRMKH